MSANLRMLARFSRRFIVALSAFGAIMVFSMWSQSPLLAALSPLFVGLVFSLTLAIQCTAAAWANRHDKVPRASMRQLLHAWISETRFAAKVFLWWQPFQSHQYPDVLPDKDFPSSSRGVVLVHGFICNRGIWNAWYPVLELKQIPYVAINLEPVIASIDSYGGLLDAAIKRMHDASGKPPLLICHSMGGLAARAWLRATRADARVHRIITIGSPHEGTQIGNWAPPWPLMTNAHQMRSGAGWLQALARQEAPVLRSKFVCFFSNCDNVVYPATSATLPGADNRHMAGLSHLAMAQDKRIMEQSLALL